MRRFKPISLFFIISLLLLTAACKKYVPGPKGEPGAPAANGNLKLRSFTNYYIAGSEWTQNGSLWETFINDPDLDASVGEVKVYMKMDSGWWCLPYAEADAFTQCSYNGNYLIRLTHYKLHGAPGPRPESGYYRAVLFSRGQ